MMLRVLELNGLFLIGDFQNFFIQEKYFWRETKGNLVFQTVSGPILLVFKIDAAIGEGRWIEVREWIEQGLSWGGPADNAHLRSQFLHYQAFVQALSGNGDAARKAAAESQRLRQSAGGEIWCVVNDMIIGGALVHIDCRDESEMLLNRAIEAAKKCSPARLHTVQFSD